MAFEIVGFLNNYFKDENDHRNSHTTLLPNIGTVDPYTSSEAEFEILVQCFWHSGRSDVISLNAFNDEQT
jgi:hypothetical protein